MNIYYKYIHILGHDEPRMSEKILCYFHDSNNNIDPNEHFFVTPHKMVFDIFSTQYTNIFYSPNHIKKKWGRQDWDGELINEWAPYCDFLIVHRMCYLLFMLEIKKCYYKKIVWRSWGGDAGLLYADGEYMKNAIKFIINQALWRNIVKQFALVGIANDVDELDLSKRAGKIKMLCMPYCVKTDVFPSLETIKKETKKCVDDNVNILIGHSGYPRDNHLEIIDALCKFKEERVQFFFPLSYGNEEYIQKVKIYASDKLGDKAHIVEEYMGYIDYAKFISSMDIGIIDGMCSQALGNIDILLFFDTKLFLNRNGIIGKTFHKNKIPFCNIDSIKKMTFEEFASPISYIGVDKKSLECKPRHVYVEEWNKVLSYLEELNR